jgi:hypothetical protein
MANHRYFAGSICAEARAAIWFGRAPCKKSPADRRAFANRKLLEDARRSGRFFFDDRIVLGLRLRTAARALGQRRLDFFDRFGLGDPLHRRDFA